MEYRYFICDVFTEERFGGNQLAVLPDAVGLSDGQMQKIAREFNFSETTFVLPPENGHTKRVRIFTPSTEIPFAGHPNLGTAFSLFLCGELGEMANDSMTVTFEEIAGLVKVTITRDQFGAITCELEAPTTLELGQTVSPILLAEALGIDETDIVTRTHEPQVASVGFPFIMVELCDLETLATAKVVQGGFDRIAETGITPDIHAYVRLDTGYDFDVRCRMFAPYEGVIEDPATGGANCALGGLLAHYDSSESGDFVIAIGQGIEMGRPSQLQARAEKLDEKVTRTWIGGRSVLVSTGLLYV